MATPSIGKIGFIGLGTMGRNMAGNLVKAGFDLVVFDVKEQALAPIEALGASVAASPKEVGAKAEVVISMLPDTPDVEAVVYGPEGLLSGDPSFKLLVDMSTIAPAAVRKTSADLRKKGIALLDAPVSGGPVGAESGTLTIMVGGEDSAFQRALPVLRAMGTTITHVGPSGAGQTLKLCNQLICGINIQAICEALALARASGVDLSILRQVLMGGSAGSWMLDKLGPGMIARDTRAGFRIDLMLKDLKLVQELAFELSVPLPATSLVTSQYLDARSHGEGGNGNQALFTVYDRMTSQASG